MAYRERGTAIRIHWPDLTMSHNSAVAQFFLGPFAKHVIVVAGVREAYDLMTRRGIELSRGKMDNDMEVRLCDVALIALARSRHLEHSRVYSQSRILLNA